MSTDDVDDDDSKKKKEPQSLFKNSSIYGYFFPQHHHTDGPFTVIANRVVKYLNDDDNNNKEKNDSEVIIVDLASGGGEPATSIAKLVPTATVYSTDILPSMNELANEYTKNIPNIRTKIVDMQNLQSEFTENSVNVITCCYGYFFPPDKSKAVLESLTILKPNGILIACNWYEQKHISILYDIVHRLTGKQYPQESKFNPQSLTGNNVFEQMLIANGFDSETIETTIHTYPLKFSNDIDFQIEILLATDTAKMLHGIDTETIKSIYTELAPFYYTVEDDNTLVAKECIYKCTTARKKK